MGLARNTLRVFAARSFFALVVMSALWVTACSSRAGEELQYNRGRLEFALPDPARKQSTESEASRRVESNMRTLRTRLEQPDVIQPLSRANAEHAGLSLGEILNLDDQWQNSPADSAFVSARVDSGCTEYMRRIILVMPSMAEVFVTDHKGVVVCQSGKTTDYYQADEQWWIDTYAQGKGRAHHGPLEFDQSAGTYAVAIYVPIFDAGSLVGIAKAAMVDSAANPSQRR